jgi:hypothetical protein
MAENEYQLTAKTIFAIQQSNELNNLEKNKHELSTTW